jgi:hypothetical protein
MEIGSKVNEKAETRSSQTSRRQAERVTRKRVIFRVNVSGTLVAQLANSFARLGGIEE